ncbi:MAG: PHP domain-containing protein [Lachnospiraceae bacterium]|nr:PHP domain-containing protein [Lachnospiraceae bacterium]
MTPLYYDLHLHSCLSPCGDDDMTPANIVGMAKLKGLDVIAITDHNSCQNCVAAMFHAKQHDIILLPGMELTTAEEVHVICLFSELVPALAFDAYVSKQILPIKNREDIFGKQQILDKQDNVVGTIEHLLIHATNISFDDVFPLVESYGGIAFPAHVDKPSNSLLSNLGFIPPTSTFQSAEFHDLKHLHKLQKKHPYFETCNIICNSDAHYLEDIHEPEYRLFAASKKETDILMALERKG